MYDSPEVYSLSRSIVAAVLGLALIFQPLVKRWLTRRHST